MTLEHNTAQVAADAVKARHVDPATGRNRQVPVQRPRCGTCGTRGSEPHEPGGELCRMMQDEREWKRRDDW